MFIIYSNLIYIPIWLDLLFIDELSNIQYNDDLHSNMVRFIIKSIMGKQWIGEEFTFQYG